MPDNLYPKYFEDFLNVTDEKEQLFEGIMKEIEGFDFQSILDIGAGNGKLSIPLSIAMPDYVAIEPNVLFAERLRIGRIKEVIEKKFPCKINRQFDLVLISHVLSYNPEEFKPFIEAAFEAVKPKGLLLIITYRSEEDDWTKLLEKLGESRAEENEKNFRQILRYTHTLGSVTLEEVTSRVRATKIEEMLKALAFVYSDANPVKKKYFLSKKEIIIKTLNKKYRRKRQYYFPLRHVMINIRKNVTM